MKKAFILLGLALGLCLTAARVQAEIVPWHINTYGVTSQAGTFTDISTNPDAVALGMDLAANADLKNRTFSQAFKYDTTYLKGVDGEDSVRDGQKVIDRITTSIDRNKSTSNYAVATTEEPVVAGFPLGFEFNLCGNKMTHFVVSAFGGVYFRNDTLQGLYTTFLSEFGSYGVFAHPFLKGGANATTTALAGAGMVFKNGTDAPAYYLIEGTEGNHVLTVQHHYTVQGADKDEWTFQFKFYEATGKIDFIVKELQYANAFGTQKWHRIFISLTDYTTYPKTLANGEPYTPTDPFAATGMQITPANGSNHRLSPAQTDEASAAGWGTFTIAGYTNEASTMRIDANGPETGRTLSFTPQDAPATVAPLTAEHYTQLNETVTENSYTAQYIYNADLLPTLSDLAAAGPIMAVISSSETPDYTLENGTLYVKEYEFAEVNGFKPKVIANMMPKVTANVSANTWAYPNKDYEVELNATGLKKQTDYYIHLYRVDYTGKNAPAYSPLCHTVPFTTSFAAPKTLKAGLADIDGVNLTVAPADDEYMGVLVIKSNTPNVKPSGQLKKGDKIGDNAVVLDLLTEEKTWKLPLAYGEGCFIVAITVNMEYQDNYAYSPENKYISVGTAYKGLPGVVEFTDLAFGVPNWEYNGIDIRTQNFRKIEPTTYRDLPFGYTRTDVEIAKDRAFGLGQPSYSVLAPRFVYAKTPQAGDDVKGDMDFITPPIVADKDRILVTFNARWMTSDDGGQIIDMTVGGEKDANLYCAIEYAVEEGEWQSGAEFYGYDLMDAEDGYFPVSCAISPDGGSFIGKKIRFRFVSKFVDPTNKVRGFVGIGSLDIKEDKLCQTVNHIALTDSLTTNTQIGLTWHDPNTPAAPAYEISYRPNNDTNAIWRTKRADKADATLENLEANTVYAIRITADCGSTFGKAYTSQTARLSTTKKFPFTDNLAQDENEIIIVNGMPVSVAGKTPFDRGVTTLVGNLPDEGYASLGTPKYGWTSSASSARIIENEKRSTSVGVRETEAQGWLLMPTVYVPVYENTVYPQTIRFKANCAHMYASEKTWTPGIGAKYTEAKLYVLLSHDGKFAKKDIVAEIEVSGKNIEHQAYEFNVPEQLLSDGRSQVAFFFSNPKATDGGEAGNEDAMLFEIYDFEYVYADDACIPTSNLVISNTTNESTSISWEGYNKVYKVFWALRSDVGYTDSVTTTETSYQLTGLQEKMRYKVRVVGYCGENGTITGPNALAALFTTSETCHVPTEFAVSGITQTEATFSSTNNQGILTQRLVYLTPQEDTVTKIILQADNQVTVNNLKSKTAYVALTRSVCGMDSSDFSEPITFTTAADSFLIMLNVMPDETYGTVKGQGRYEKGSNATITAIPAEGYQFVAWKFGDSTVSTESVYTFEVKASGTYTAVFTERGTEANEEAVGTAFNVSAKAGYLYIQNLKGLTIEEVTVYGVTGRQLGRFTPRSREDLSLPVAAEHAVLVVRVASEQGLATYKVYLH